MDLSRLHQAVAIRKSISLGIVLEVLHSDHQLISHGRTSYQARIPAILHYSQRESAAANIEMST